MALSKQLPAITEKQKQWGIVHCFPPVGYVSKNKVWCLECGHIFEKVTSVVGDEAICPHCGKKLKLEMNKSKEYKQAFYYTILTTKEGYQVCRHFIVEKWAFKRPEEQPLYDIYEVVQNWISETGKETIVARSCKPLPLIYDYWDKNTPMSIKRRTVNCYALDKYDIEAYCIYPQKKVLPILKRNGYTGRFHGISASELFKLLIKDHEAESLIKNKQFGLLRYKYKKGLLGPEYKLPYQHSIRIANRNSYIIKDASMWYDYLDLLKDFGKDTHNAYYVCPKKMKKAHDVLFEKKRQVLLQEELVKQKERMKEWEEKYKADKEKYLGICFGNEDIVITVIQSVAEMEEEGRHMRHCVFQAQYFLKKFSLILSAKSRVGKRIETIELDLQSMKVIQSRGACNHNTPYHEEILELVNHNINLFKVA